MPPFCEQARQCFQTSKRPSRKRRCTLAVLSLVLVWISVLPDYVNDASCDSVWAQHCWFLVEPTDGLILLICKAGIVCLPPSFAMFWKIIEKDAADLSSSIYFSCTCGQLNRWFPSSAYYLLANPSQSCRQNFRDHLAVHVHQRYGTPWFDSLEVLALFLNQSYCGLSLWDW